MDPCLHRIVIAQPYPLLFAAISGAHLYGFPSPDSDYDLRAAHAWPLDAVVGLEVRNETVEDSRVIGQTEANPLENCESVAESVISPECHAH